MLVKGCKNIDQNRATKDKEPQLHKAKLVQHKSNTVSLTFSAGNPFGTCVEMQTAFTVPALKEKLSFPLVSGSQNAQKSTVSGQIRNTSKV